MASGFIGLGQFWTAQPSRGEAQKRATVGLGAFRKEAAGKPEARAALLLQNCLKIRETHWQIQRIGGFLS